MSLTCKEIQNKFKQKYIIFYPEHLCNVVVDFQNNMFIVKNVKNV